MASSLSITRSCPVHVYYTCLISNTRIFCLSSRHLTRPLPRSKSTLALSIRRSITLISRVEFPFSLTILARDYSVNYPLYDTIWFKRGRLQLLRHSSARCFALCNYTLYFSFWTSLNSPMTSSLQSFNPIIILYIFAVYMV